MFFTCSLLVAADEPLDKDALDKDIQDSLTSVFSTWIDQQQRFEEEVERLVEKYGTALIEPMKKLVVEEKIHYQQRNFPLAVLVRLGKSEPVKQAFLELIKNPNYPIRRDSLYMSAKIDKETAGDIAVEAINTTDDPMVKETIVPLLGVIDDPNMLSILKELERDDSQYKPLKEAARQAREYLEHRLNLATEEERKSWERQAFVYWLLPKEVEERRYRAMETEYYKQAELMAERGHRFSLDFLRYHLSRNDPLAAAIIGFQKEKDAIEDLKMCLQGDKGEKRMLKSVCRGAIRMIEKKQDSEKEIPGKKTTRVKK